MDDFRSRFTIFLIHSNSLKVGKFKLSSGLESNYYIDLRNIQSYPSIFHEIVILLRDKIINEKIEFDLLATVPTSGLVFTSALAYEIFKPLIYVRKESKGYGVNNLIEGEFEEENKVLLLDDVITTGKSLIHAIDVIKRKNLKINNVISLLFRGNEETIEKFTKIGIDLKFLITMKEISDVIYSNNLIDEEKRQKLK
ncbi:MAG: orotate phosphoribosyltransferase [Nitrososphaeraceae archaeon]